MALKQDKSTKFAIRKLIRLPNGTVGVAFVDAETGVVLNSLEGYMILDPDSGSVTEPSESEKTDATPDESTLQEQLDIGPNNRIGASDTTALDIGSGLKNYSPTVKDVGVRGLIGTAYDGIRDAITGKSNLPETGPTPTGASRGSVQPGLSSPSVQSRGLARDESAPVSPVERASLAEPSIPSPSSGRVGLGVTGGRTEPGRSVNTPTTERTSTGRAIEPGKGLANLTGAPGNVEFGLGPKRPDMPEQTIVDIVRDSAVAVLGPNATVSVFSGKQSPDKQYGSNRHTTGTAVDVHFKDEQGRIVTDEDTLSNIAREASNRGAKGIGFGKGYMGGIGMHIDRVEPNPEIGQDYAWGTGANKIENELKNNIESYARYARTDTGLAPTPTSAPRSLSATIDMAGMTPQEKNSLVERAQSLGASVMFEGDKARVDITNLDDDNKTPEQKSVSQSIIDSVTAPSIEAPKSYKDTLAPDVDVTKMSPAELSATGYGLARTPEEKEQMAFAIAGELGPKTLEGVAKRDPAALREFGAIVSTMENRAQSARNQDKGLAATVAPGMYSSLNPGMKDQTATNYGLYGGAIKTALDDFYSGKMPDIATPATHYANFGIVNPEWAGSLQAPPQQIGQHGFGVANILGTDRPEYAPGSRYAETMRSAVDRVGTDRINSSPIGDYGVGSANSQSLGLVSASQFGDLVSERTRGFGEDYGRPDAGIRGYASTGTGGISGSVGHNERGSLGGLLSSVSGEASGRLGGSSVGGSYGGSRSPSVGGGTSSGITGGRGEPGRSTSSTSSRGSVGGSVGSSSRGSIGGSVGGSASSPSVGGGVSSGISGGRGEPGRSSSSPSSTSSGLAGWDGWI